MSTRCAKVRYPTRRRARQFARQARTGTRLTAYRCTTCGFWHLTSQDAATRVWHKDHPVPDPAGRL